MRPPNDVVTTLVPDRDALLAALVLAPTVYARNRFFDMFRDPSVRGVRARASQLRSLVRHVGGEGRERAEGIERHHDNAGRVIVRYGIGTLNLRRTVALSPLEADLVDVALARLRDQQPPEAAWARVQAALSRLALAA